MVNISEVNSTVKLMNILGTYNNRIRENDVKFKERTVSFKKKEALYYMRTIRFFRAFPPSRNLLE